MTIIKSQKIKFSGRSTCGKYDVTATLRHDDQCGNGHNSTSVTGEVYQAGKPRIERYMDSCGCVHEQIADAIPELKPAIKFHLCSTDGLMHYIENTIYNATEIPEKQDKYFLYMSDNAGRFKDVLLGIYKGETCDAIERAYSNATLRRKDIPNSMAKPANIEHARSSACWPDATIEQLTDREALAARLPGLLAEHKATIESYGLTY